MHGIVAYSLLSLMYAKKIHQFLSTLERSIRQKIGSFIERGIRNVPVPIGKRRRSLSSSSSNWSGMDRTDTRASASHRHLRHFTGSGHGSLDYNPGGRGLAPPKLPSIYFGVIQWRAGGGGCTPLCINLYSPRNGSNTKKHNNTSININKTKATTKCITSK